MKILFAKLREDAIIPKKSYETDAGYDFYCLEDFEIYPNEYVLIDTQIAWEPSNIPEGWLTYMQIKSRSGMGIKKGLEATNAGVIDQSYRGSIKIKIYNFSNIFRKIEKGTRIAQGIVQLIPKLKSEEIDKDELTITNRNKGGLGSTGDK
jgi:dUTP pyrophosphatase